jgi:hypothetical protein
VTRTLKAIYSKAVNINSSKDRLNSEVLVVAGKEFLRLANKVGKGWFAVLLSERLDSRTYIPAYILRAVAFACHPSISEGALKRIAEFRIVAQSKHEGSGDTLPQLADIEDLSPTDALSVFREAAPDDDLSLFCEYIEEYREQ